MAGDQEEKPLLLADAYTHPEIYRGHDEAIGHRTKSLATVPLKQMTQDLKDTTADVKRHPRKCSGNRNT